MTSPYPRKVGKENRIGAIHVELGKLLPDYLSATNAMGDIADAPKVSKPVTRPILSIIEWVQSFGHFFKIPASSYQTRP